MIDRVEAERLERLIRRKLCLQGEQPAGVRLLAVVVLTLLALLGVAAIGVLV